MSARYKFVCRSCKFRHILSIGRERGANYLSLSMLCRQCKDVAEYKLTDPIDLHRLNYAWLTCVTCHSSDYLVEWDAMSCPKCDRLIRVIGWDLNSEKPNRYSLDGIRRRL